ncbi:MAG: DNA-binding protein [Proteobacteria bacterium]|nr:DNA-binding protein [Pseudomonadota bacterium]
MADFDFDVAVRWGRFDPQRSLARRNDTELPFLSEEPEAGSEVLLDTCVYIDSLQGRAPEPLLDLLDIRKVNHSTVAIQELMHTVGVLDPRHPNTKTAIHQIRTVVQAMRPHRIFVPDPDLLGRAALLSGMLCRLQGYDKDDRLRALQDSILFLQSNRLGLTLVTGNIKAFDYLLQLIPSGRVLFYRKNG